MNVVTVAQSNDSDDCLLDHRYQIKFYSMEYRQVDSRCSESYWNQRLTIFGVGHVVIFVANLDTDGAAANALRHLTRVAVVPARQPKNATCDEYVWADKQVDKRTDRTNQCCCLKSFCVSVNVHSLSSSGSASA